MGGWIQAVIRACAPARKKPSSIGEMPGTPMDRGPLSLLIDLDSREAEEMDALSLASAGLKERSDLQRWITEHPDTIAPGLLLITTEFDRWEVRDHNVADRLDALFLDTSGAPVVVELKRDRAADTVELQALKYAAYCSQLTLDELAEEFSTTHGGSKEDAHQRMLDHAPALEEGGLRSIKVILVAGSFGPAVTSVVLWLRESNIDIGCVEVAARAVPDAKQAVLTTRQIIPLPEAEDYLVRRRRKEQEEDLVRQQPAEGSWDSYASRFPTERVAVARSLFERLTRYVDANDLVWTPTLRSWWLGYKRPGGYYVAVINLRVEKPIEFMVKLPASPAQLDLQNPYPQLTSRWEESTRQWGWAVPTAGDVPDVTAAVDIARAHQPDKGPMPTSP
jgi:hypothetical protein